MAEIVERQKPYLGLQFDAALPATLKCGMWAVKVVASTVSTGDGIFENDCEIRQRLILSISHRKPAASLCRRLETLRGAQAGYSMCGSRARRSFPQGSHPMLETGPSQATEPKRISTAKRACDAGERM